VGDGFESPGCVNINMTITIIYMTIIQIIPKVANGKRFITPKNRGVIFYARVKG